MADGWIKLYRTIWDNPVVTKDTKRLAVWIYLLTNASHCKKSIVFNGRKTDIEPGELITGRKIIAKRLDINESSVERILNEFKIEHQIEQRTDHQNRVISILNWEKYQSTEQGCEQRPNNDRTTTEHNQELKNEKNINNNINKQVSISNKYIYKDKGLPAEEEFVPKPKYAMPVEIHNNAGKTKEQIWAEIGRKVHDYYGQA